jgi:hypothetical protein
MMHTRNKRASNERNAAPLSRPVQHQGNLAKSNIWISPTCGHLERRASRQAENSRRLCSCQMLHMPSQPTAPHPAAPTARVLVQSRCHHHSLLQPVAASGADIAGVSGLAQEDDHVDQSAGPETASAVGYPRSRKERQKQVEESARLRKIDGTAARASWSNVHEIPLSMPDCDRRDLVPLPLVPVPCPWMIPT